jgi:hypothetical protein
LPGDLPEMTMNQQEFMKGAVGQWMLGYAHKTFSEEYFSEEILYHPDIQKTGCPGVRSSR